MAVILRDDTRRFPLQAVPYLDVTLDDLFENLLSIKRANCPDWTDETTSDFGIQLLWLFSVMSKWTSDHLERAKNNSFVGTTTDREVMRQLCELVDYQLGSASAASVSVTFTAETGHPEFTIPAGTKVGTVETDDQETIIFETNADHLVQVSDSSVDVACTQGEAVDDDVVGSSDATVGQSFTLAYKPVVWESETVEVNEGAWATWTRVSNFVDSDASDKHYRVEALEDKSCRVIFGDGINGLIPARGTNNVRVSYRKGGGIDGNVVAGTIIELLSAVSNVESVNNVLASSGGMERETLDHARMFAPATIKTLDRAVTTGDLETLCEEYTSTVYGGVAKAKAFILGSYSAWVAVVPKMGGVPTFGLKTALESVLNSRRMVCSLITVADPDYYLVDITANVAVLPNYSMSAVCNEVRARLVTYLSPCYQDPETGLYPHAFGRNLYLSDIWSIINDTPGVDYCRVTLPAGNTIVPEYQIADIGSITLDAYGEGGDVSFVDANVIPNYPSVGSIKGRKTYKESIPR